MPWQTDNEPTTWLAPSEVIPMSVFLWISAENIGIYCRATSSMSYASLSAEELVRACAESGNTEAWEEFVRRFRLVIGSAVRRSAYTWRRNRRNGIDRSGRIYS